MDSRWACGRPLVGGLPGGRGVPMSSGLAACRATTVTAPRPMHEGMGAMARAEALGTARKVAWGLRAVQGTCAFRSGAAL